MTENMSEGKLYSDLTKQRFSCMGDGLFTGNDEKIDKNDSIHLDDFKQKLDEAKAEYLGLQDQWRKENPHPEITDYHGDQLAQMREKWFEKWFGEAI